jgi:hypothetical protein
VAQKALRAIYTGIFGSQIAGLLQLEARRQVSADEVHAFFKTYEDRHPEAYAGYGFAGWIGFLKQRELVTVKDTTYSITPFGDEFLRWMRSANLPQDKAY